MISYVNVKRAGSLALAVIGLVLAIGTGSAVGSHIGMTGAVRGQGRKLDRTIQKLDEKKPAEASIAGLTISGPASDVPMLVGSQSTTMTISAYVTGPVTSVRLYQLTSGYMIPRSVMNDNGNNGDKTAGDRVYSALVTLAEPTDTSVVLRVQASGGGLQQTRDFVLPVVQLQFPATALESSTRMAELFQVTQSTQADLIGIALTQGGTSSTTWLGLQGNLALMFKKFEEVTHQDVGLQLLGWFSGFFKNTRRQDIFAENPLDPRVADIRQYYNMLSDDELREDGHDLLFVLASDALFDKNAFPNGYGKNFRDLGNVAVKLVNQPAQLLTGGALDDLGLGLLKTTYDVVTNGVDFAKALVDWSTTANGDLKVLIGQVSSGEQFAVPSGTHNLYGSWGGDVPMAVSENVAVPALATTTVNFTPANLSLPNAPSVLVATAISDTAIVLGWHDLSSVEDGFKIQIGTDGTTFAPARTVGTNVASFSSTGLSSSTTYFYRVQSYNAKGSSAYSNIASAMTLVPATEVLTAPSLPYGPVAAPPGTSISYMTGGSTSNLGHGVEYRFNWGDGNYSAWSAATSASHIWAGGGTYYVTVSARCQIHTTVTVASSPKVVLVDAGYGDPNQPVGSPKWASLISGSAGSSPAFSNGLIYFADYTVDANGIAVKWAIPSNNRSPMISSDGTMYVGNAFLYAAHSDGTQKWLFTPPCPYSFSLSDPCIANDGTIYATCLYQCLGCTRCSAYGSWDYKSLIAINSDGTKKWEYDGVWGTSSSTSSPSVAIEGTVYVGFGDGKIYAINPNGILKWSYLTGAGINSSPAIGSDRTIYVGSNDSKVYAMDPDFGTPKWIYTTGGAVQSSAAIGSDGVIYVGSDDKSLYAINPNGTLKWSYATGGAVQSSPAIGSDGVIYVGSNDKSLYAINSNGTLKWSYSTGGAVQSSPAIADDGTIYFGSNDGYLHALVGTGSLATAPWPKFRHDLRNTGGK